MFALIEIDINKNKREVCRTETLQDLILEFEKFPKSIKSEYVIIKDVPAGMVLKL